MQLHQLKPTHKIKDRKRVGRGGKRGTYSGRGGKGQTARAGHRLKPAIRELIKRYPKLRGYGFPVAGEDLLIAIVNLDVLDKHFKDGETVSPQILLERGLIRRIKGVIPKVKILGGGKITKALTFENCLFSKQAKEKIEKANGGIK